MSLVCILYVACVVVVFALTHVHLVPSLPSFIIFRTFDIGSLLTYFYVVVMLETLFVSLSLPLILGLTPLAATICKGLAFL